MIALFLSQNRPDTLYRDSRIPALIRNGLQEKKRSFFVVVGDRGKDIIVNLHHIMSQMELKQNKSVLWAYKSKLLNFTRYAGPRASYPWGAMN